MISWIHHSSQTSISSTQIDLLPGGAVVLAVGRGRQEAPVGEGVLSLTHRPHYPHTPDHNHLIINYHHLYLLPSPHISLLTSFPRRLVSRLYAVPYLWESCSSSCTLLQERDKDYYLPVCELHMTIYVGSYLAESTFCL